MYKDYEIKLNAILDKHNGVQKVELGLIDDLAKQVAKAEDKHDNAKDKLRKALSDMKTAMQEFGKAYKIASEATSAAQKLGSKEAIKSIKNRLGIIDNKNKSANKIVKSLSGLL